MKKMHASSAMIHAAVILAMLVAITSMTTARRATIRVAAGEDLQQAIDAAASGDVLELEAGATFVGNFILPAKEGDAFITIRSSTPDTRLPNDRQRILPSEAPLLARLQSPNALPVIQTAPGAHHWRLLFLEIGPNATPGNDLIRFGDGSSQQTSLDNLAHHLEIDRCFIHGDPIVGQKRGLALNSGEARIVNSHFADFKLAGQDTQAIAGWNGPGPYLIENNYLEAAGENILFGGADPAIRDLVPSDIVIRANHISRPLTWRGERWQVKNLLEFKNAQRVLVEHNTLEHNWQAAQPGFAILLTPRNQDGRAPWTVVQDITFRSNIVRHAAAGFNILGVDNNAPSRQTRNVTLTHNLIVELDGGRWGGNGVALQIGDAPADLVIDHNTLMQNGNAINVYGKPVRGFEFTNNVVRHNTFGIKGDGRAAGLDTLQTYFPDAVVSHNLFGGGTASAYPAGNHFVSMAAWPLHFLDYARGDFTLSPASTYRTAARSGGAVGLDPDTILEATLAPLGRR